MGPERRSAKLKRVFRRTRDDPLRANRWAGVGVGDRSDPALLRLTHRTRHHTLTSNEEENDG